jgi:hypothetical protein
MQDCCRRCYHQNEVKPQTIGRTLGIGLRVAGRMAGQRVAAGAQTAGVQGPSAQASANPPSVPMRQFDPEAARSTGKTAGKVTRRAARGVGGFLKPFRRVGGILWLEVMGVFFFLPVAVFAPVMWRARLNWASGPDHRTFLMAAVIVAIFLYLSLSSFWRARKR